MYHYWTILTKKSKCAFWLLALGFLGCGRVFAAEFAPLPTNAVNASVLTPVAPTNTNSLPATLNGYVPDDKYRLRAGDRVAFQILEDRDAPKGLMVADSGELDVPYVGRVAV